MTIQDAINEYVRIELSDKEITRWENSDLLVFFKQAVRRANAIGLRNGFPFMRGKLEATIAAGADTILIPDDFFSPIGIWRTDTHSKLCHIDIDEYENIVSASPLGYWMIDGNNIMFKDAADTDTPIRMRYYVDYKPQNFTLSSQVPWDDKLTMIMCDYVKIRARNVDEYILSEDKQLLSDLESEIISAYGGLNPNTEEAYGAFNL